MNVTKFFLLIGAVCVALATGCQEAKNAGDEIGDAARDAADAVEDAGHDAVDQMEDAADEVEDAVN